MSKYYNQLTDDERIEIYAMRQAGNSIKEIAEALSRHRSTLNRESIGTPAKKAIGLNRLTKKLFSVAIRQLKRSK